VVLIQLLLPVKTPDGTNATAALAETRRELVERFHGVTAYLRSPAQGLWVAPDGHAEADDVVIVEVVAETFERNWWRAYRRQLAERFAQKEIHVRSIAVETPDDQAG